MPPTGNPHDRSSWPVRVARLADEAAPTDETTAEQRLAMMWELVTQAWAVAGLPLPSYERAQAPVRVVRRDEADLLDADELERRQRGK